MERIFKPFWILLLFTLPVIILFSLFGATYRVIHSLLDGGTIYYWIAFGSVLGGMTLLATLYAIYCWFRSLPIHPLYSYLSLSSLIIYLYIYMQYVSEVLPWGIPDWMLFQGDVQVYVYTFCLPAMFLALMQLIVYYSPEAENQRAWINFGIALFFPFAWYLFFNLGATLLPFVPDGDYEYLRHIFSVLMMSSTVVFLFFLARFFYILGSKWNVGGHLERWDLAWKIPLGIIFPLLGLYLNNHSFNMVFGDFSETTFYVLAFLNGIFLCLPNSLDGGLRWIIFFLRLTTFPFIFYFFLVFLPFLPLSIPAIIIFGTGFLMMTPTALLMTQIAMMYRDYLFLRERSGKATPTALMIIGLSVLPLACFYVISADRDNLEKALDYVYAPNYEAPLADVHPGRLLYTLENIKQAKTSDGGGIFPSSHYKPYLSNFYQWWVMENLTLADRKIRNLERLFAGRESDFQSFRRRRLAPERSDSVQIQEVRIESSYDSKNKNWRSWVHFEINNPTKRQQEFNRTLQLPPGTWISNYYLDIEGRREYGILAEKKAAKWVYQQIVSRRRDPGILSYEEGENILFRVFPFAGKETRTTGIELIHKYPLEWSWEGQRMLLGDSSRSVKREIQQVDNAYFVPAERKAEMPLLRRQPYLHFMVDASLNQKKAASELIDQINQLQKKQALSSDQTKISLVNYQVKTFDHQEKGRTALNNFKPRGGFYLGFALKSALLKHYKANKNTYPVFIVISDSLSEAILGDELKDFKMTYPESNILYRVTSNGALEQSSLWNPKAGALGQLIEKVDLPSVRVFKKNGTTIAYLRDDQKDEVICLDDQRMKIVKQDGHPGSDQINEKSWGYALGLRGDYQTMVFHPEESQFRWLDLVKKSFRSQVMTPVTSYISLENEAQKQALKEKQKQILNAKKSLDAGDEMQQMSEPGFWILLLLLVMFLVFRQYQSTRRLIQNP